MRGSRRCSSRFRRCTRPGRRGTAWRGGGGTRAGRSRLRARAYPKNRAIAIKTDRRDAERLARLLARRRAQRSACRRPREEQLRDLVRAREDLRVDLMRAAIAVEVPAAPRAVLPHAGQAWTGRAPRLAGDRALRRCGFGADFQDALEAHDRCSPAGIGSRGRCAARRAVGLGADDRRLRCLRGVDMLTAVGLACGGRRLPAVLASDAARGFLGLVPSEDSTGERRRQGSITKAGLQARPPLARRGGLALPPARRAMRSTARTPPARPRPTRDRDRLALPTPPHHRWQRLDHERGKRRTDHRRRRRPRARDLLLGARHSLTSNRGPVAAARDGRFARTRWLARRLWATARTTAAPDF